MRTKKKQLFSHSREKHPNPKRSTKISKRKNREKQVRYKKKKTIQKKRNLKHMYNENKRGGAAATTNVFGGTANQNVFGGNSNASAFGNSAATSLANNQFQVSSTNTNASFGGAARASPNGSGSTVFGSQAAPFSPAPANTTFGTVM